ncbi:unnamed protein product [Nyctereutes procyonoides]|uniref:(raccoon dog) hypothetical protein n=1 Tax=Nyctereutes procyonoides TaxID=34880 RepID=A0A811YDN1_NYCPR|nr:unnamed protein product [Nyctereutes procyonoides]
MQEKSIKGALAGVTKGEVLGECEVQESVQSSRLELGKSKEVNGDARNRGASRQGAPNVEAGGCSPLTAAGGRLRCRGPRGAPQRPGRARSREPRRPRGLLRGRAARVLQVWRRGLPGRGLVGAARGAGPGVLGGRPGRCARAGTAAARACSVGRCGGGGGGGGGGGCGGAGHGCGWRAGVAPRGAGGGDREKRGWGRRRRMVAVAWAADCVPGARVGVGGGGGGGGGAPGRVVLRVGQDDVHDRSAGARCSGNADCVSNLDLFQKAFFLKNILFIYLRKSVHKRA